MKFKTLIHTAALSVAVAQSASAGTHVWSGASTNSNWNNPANWSAGGVPTLAELAPVNLSFPVNGSSNSVMNIDGLKVHQIVIDRDNMNISGTAGAKLVLVGAPSPNNNGLYLYGDNVQLNSSIELVLSNEFKINTSGHLKIYSKISGSGSLLLTGSGKFEMLGSLTNSYTGLTTVDYKSELILGRTSGNAINGDLLIDGAWLEGNVGYTVAVKENGLLRIIDDNQINDASVVTSKGNILLTNANELIGELRLLNSLVETTNGILTLPGTIAVEKLAGTPCVGIFGCVTPGSTIRGSFSLGFPSSGRPTYRTLTVSNDTTLAIDAPIIGNALADLKIQGGGEIEIFRASTYLGDTLLAEGKVILHSASSLGATNGDTTILENGYLSITNGSVLTEPLTLIGSTNGSPKSQLGGWTYDGGLWTNTLNGSLTLSNQTAIGADLAGCNININGAISGSGSLTLANPNTLSLGGTNGNTFTGGLIAPNGIVRLLKSANVTAIAGPIDLGTTNTSVYSAELIVLNTSQIGDTAPVHVSKNGILTLGAASDTIGSLELTGGQVTTTTGTLTLNGDLTTNPSDTTATIIGKLSLGSQNRIMNIAGGAANPDLYITAVISGSAGFTKIGDGSLRLENANSYGGSTIVNKGDLQVWNPTALGTTVNGTTVNNGGTLTLKAAQTITNEWLYLNDGTLLSSGGTNEWAGPVTFATNGVFTTYLSNTLFRISGIINGTGGLKKYGFGTLELAGTSGNTFSGATIVANGTLALKKVNGGVGLVSIPSTALSIGGVSGSPDPAAVKCFYANQINDNTVVTVATNGTFTLNSVIETVGSLTGAGTVALGNSSLTVGGDNTSTLFSGPITGVGGSLSKTGTGVLNLTGANTYSGTTYVKGGTLLVNHSNPNTAVNITLGAKVGGSGSVGVVQASPGILSPGNSVGTLNTSNLSLNSSSTVQVELNGTTPGTGHDQINVTGSINLANATLNTSLGFASVAGNQFVIIKNDGADAIVGQFAGLNEGAIFSLNGKMFQITYTGGDGNDVVLTQIVSNPPQIGGISRNKNGTIQLNGTGTPGLTYTIQANADLSTTNWVDLGSVTAGSPDGAVAFIDLVATNFPARFYRFVAP